MPIVATFGRWVASVSAALAAPPPSDPSNDATPKAEGSRPPEGTFGITAQQKIGRIYPADGIDPLKYKSILRNADVGYTAPLMELLDDVASDVQVGSQLRSRKLAVAGKPYEIKPGEDSDRGRAIAEAAKVFVGRISNFKQFRLDILDAPFRGFAAVQPQWIADKGAWWWGSWEAIESRFFEFKNATTPVIYTEAHPGGEELPPGVLLHTSRDKAGPIVRGGVGRSVGKLWLYKGYNLVDCASWLERFGHPHVQVQLPPHVREGSPEYVAAQKAARAFIADQAALVPAGVTIALVEALNKATNIENIYIPFLRWCDEGIAKAIRGHAASSELGPARLGSGKETEQAMDVAQDIVELDAGQFDEFFNAQVLGPWKIYHFGTDAPAPRFCTIVAPPADEKQQAETRKTEAETIEVLKRIGLKIDEPTVRVRFDQPEPASDDDVLGGVQPAAPAAAPPMDPAMNRDGACPHCGGFFTFSEAEKKKRSLISGASRS